MELSILVVMQICIKMGPINSQLLVYHHSKILKKWKSLHKKNRKNSDGYDELMITFRSRDVAGKISVSVSVFVSVANPDHLAL